MIGCLKWEGMLKEAIMGHMLFFVRFFVAKFHMLIFIQKVIEMVLNFAYILQSLVKFLSPALWEFLKNERINEWEVLLNFKMKTKVSNGVVNKSQCF